MRQFLRFQQREQHGSPAGQPQARLNVRKGSKADIRRPTSRRNVTRGVEKRHLVLHPFASSHGGSTLRRNFEFDLFSVVRWRDKSIDLHNAYDLESFGTDLRGGEVRLSFTRNQHAMDPGNLPSKVTLACTGKVRIAFNDLTEIAAPLDHEGIQIAYFDEACDWLSFLDEEIAQRQEPQGLHVSFVNGLAIRIYCDEATLAVHIE